MPATLNSILHKLADTIPFRTESEQRDFHADIDEATADKPAEDVPAQDEAPKDSAPAKGAPAKTGAK